MSEISERYRRVAAGFTERVSSVPDDAWDNPSPCEKWKARDVVRHLVEWPPMFFTATYGVEFPEAPSVDEDPVAAWQSVNTAIQAALDDPEVAGVERDTPLGRSSLEQTVDFIGTGDVLIHTWDLARATGLDETLDAEAVGRMLARMSSIDEETIRGSGQFGPRVDVPADADDQTRLIAFSGRRP